MDQAITRAGAPPPTPTSAPRPWRRISLTIQQVEQQPAKLFSLNRGPYTLRIDVAVTAALIRRVGWMATAALAAAQPQLWKWIQQLFVAVR
jgi:hypothetical protein